MRHLALALALALAATAASAQDRAPVPTVSTNRSAAATTGTPSVQAPGVTVNQTDLCVATAGLGTGTPTQGLTLFLPWADRACRRIRLAKALAELDRRAAAVQLLCRERDVRAAMAAAGTPCEPAKEAP